LGGNGTVGATTIQSGGTIAPGNSIGTLHINGAFVQNAGSIYQLQLDPNSNASDLTLVDGAASIANGAVLAVAKNSPGGYRPDALYTVLTASGGVAGDYTVTGDTAASAYLALQEEQDANNIYLHIVQTGDPATAAQTPNQTGVADSLPTGSGPQIAVLNTPDPAATRAAFDQLSGEALASAKSALVSGSVLVRDTTFDRLRDVLCPPDGRTDDAVQPVRGACSDRPALWAQGFGNWGNIGGNDNAAGLTQSTGGFLIGADVPVYGWRIGYFGGFSRTDFAVKGRASWGKSDNYHLGAYAGTAWGDLSLRLGAAYGWSGIDTNRTVTIGDYTDQLHAFTNASTTQLFGELGQRFAFGTIALEPFANLAYVNLRTDGFRETGGEAALTAKAGTQEDGFSTLGVRPSTVLSWGGLDAILRGMLGWRHTFGDVTPNSVVSFAGGNSFTVEGAPIARDAGVVEAGADFAVRDNVTAGLTYGGQFGGGETDNGVRGTLAIAF
jgi:outer membrane autotransporter protein